LSEWSGEGADLQAATRARVSARVAEEAQSGRGLRGPLQSRSLSLQQGRARISVEAGTAGGAAAALGSCRRLQPGRDLRETGRAREGRGTLSSLFRARDRSGVEDRRRPTRLLARQRDRGYEDEDRLSVLRASSADRRRMVSALLAWTVSRDLTALERDALHRWGVGYARDVLFRRAIQRERIAAVSVPRHAARVAALFAGEAEGDSGCAQGGGVDVQRRDHSGASRCEVRAGAGLPRSRARH